MSYDVYVTRALHHFDGAQLPIAEGDWRALIENDPDLQAPDEAYPSYAVWSGTPSPGSHWIDWANGNLFTRKPDQSLLRKLLELAELLGAKVQGHRGEVYGLDERGDPLVVSPADVEAVRSGLDGPRGPSSADGADPWPEFSPEGFFGPHPQTALDGPEPAAEDPALHAETSFARSPDDHLTVERGTARAVDIRFKVGQRVRTRWGQPATIVSIDRQADGGPGTIEIRYRDGRVATIDGASHGLEPVGD